MQEITFFKQGDLDCPIGKSWSKECEQKDLAGFIESHKPWGKPWLETEEGFETFFCESEKGGWGVKVSAEPGKIPLLLLIELELLFI